MVMGQFLTTQRKDFLWPYVTTIGFKPEPEKPLPSHVKAKQCHCHQLKDVGPTNRQKIGPDAIKDDQWSRLGPMGPLLEPKAFGARVSAAPETEISKYNQPNVFMRKLKEKYPFIYECLKTAPPDDLISRINKERLSTTYQVDYCNKREFPAGPYEELLAAAGVEGLPPCPEPVKIPGDVCRRGGKVNAKKDSSFSKKASFETKKEEIPLGSCRGGAFTVSHNSTEYMDTHSRLGNLIIVDGIHDPARNKTLFTEKPHIFPERALNTVPKSPPGPYYSPCPITSCLTTTKENFSRCQKNIDDRKSCAKNYIREMSGWNPFDKNKPPSSDCVEKWGKINFLNDCLHRHTDHYELRKKR